MQEAGVSPIIDRIHPGVQHLKGALSIFALFIEMFSHVIIAAIALLAVQPTFAEEPAINPDASLFETAYGNNTEDFLKKCGKVHRAFSRVFRNNTVNVTTYNIKVQQYHAEGKLPMQLGQSKFLEHADSDKDNIVTKDEFCNSVSERLNSIKVKDLTNADLEPETLVFIKKNVCSWKDKIPGMKSQLCTMVEDALDKAEEKKEKQEYEQEQQVSIEKRDDKKLFKIGGALAIMLGVLNSITALILLPTIIGAGLFGTIAAFFFIIGKGLLDKAKKME